MAPTIEHLATLAARYTGYSCPSGYYYSRGYCYSRSKWNRWGRWVVLGLAIALFLLVLLSLMMRSRKRRQQGRPALYGTGWMGGNTQPQNQMPPQYGNAYAGAPPPPEYSQQPYPQYVNPNGQPYNSNQGYYGGQGPNDVPLQEPTQAYQPTRGGAADDYAPPAGPPPGKH